jgi:hypothetical protein
MQKLSAVLGLGVSVLLMSCGGSGSSSPSAPSSSSGGSTTTAPAAATTATTTTTTTSGLFTFTFEAGTQVSDQDLVKNAFTAASSFYQSAVGRTVTQATTVKLSVGDAGCANPGASAFTGPRTMTICGSNNGWTVHNTLNRTKILTHEFFHLIQFEMRWTGNATGSTGSQWLVEGSAEYLGWRGVANSGLVSLDNARGCNVKGATDKGAAASAGLDTLESPAGFGVPWSYELSMLGVDQLVNASGMPALITYGNAIANGSSYGSAFQTAFGTSTTAFYSGFPTYRANLAGLSSSACGT